MLPAPYIIVGWYVTPETPGADDIARDIQTQMPLASSPHVSLGVPNVDAYRVTSADMHDRLDEAASFFVGMNQAHDGVIRWFAQLCNEAWIAME